MNKNIKNIIIVFAIGIAVVLLLENLSERIRGNFSLRKAKRFVKKTLANKEKKTTFKKIKDEGPSILVINSFESNEDLIDSNFASISSLSG